MKKKVFLAGLLLLFCIAGAVLIFCDFGEKEEQKGSPGETMNQAESAGETDLLPDEKEAEIYPDSEEKTAPEVLPEKENAAVLPENTNPDNKTDSAGDAYTVFQDALFIGDSRTEGLSLYSGITNADFFCAKSLSIDRILDGAKVGSGKNKRTIYEQLARKTYSKVYISLGLNELGWTYIDRFTDDYETLIHEIQKNQPNAVIYVQALIPVTAEKSERDTVENNNQIYWYNTHLVTVAENTGAVYLNADKPLIGEDGALLPDATTDGVHFKSHYCKLWAARIAELSE